jgi:transcription elongation GreA/GreB family factor
MNKIKIFEQIKKELDLKYDLAKAAVKEAYATATDKENIAENKYDTTGLEASYLVQGQARRLEELQHSINAFNQMTISSEKANLVTLGTLFMVEENEKTFLLFVATHAGGLKVQYENTEIMVITVNSPIGKALAGKKIGNSVEVTIGRNTKTYIIQELF